MILGVADIPGLNERYVGYGKISYKIIKGKKSLLKVKNYLSLREATLNTTSPFTYANKKDQKKFEKVAKVAKATRLGGDCYSYCLLADGYIDLIMESGLSSYDIRALIPIIKNAGGSIKTWDNKNPRDGGKIIAANNSKLLNQVQSMIAE